MDIKKLKEQFFNLYGKGDCKIYFAPGRVNLIGEHVDYNGGRVFPCALSYGTYLIVREREDDSIFFASENFEYKIRITTDQILRGNDEWVKYPMGVIDQFQQKGVRAKGMELLFAGNIPNGAGLSSSASVELVMAVAFNELTQLNLNQVELVKMSQRAENEFVGVNCGIMDQFAIGMGVKNHALALNCDTLEYDLVPLDMDGYKLVIGNTNKQRGLADSKYNERRSECDQAVELLRKEKEINFLCELTESEFENLKHLIGDETLLKRAKHVVSEHGRVTKAVLCLIDKDMVRFGQFMNASHDSLRDDYEVTGVELDTMVEEARKIDGVLGSRMTGAGFGGCTVSLVKEEVVDSFIKTVGENYKNKVGLDADFYVAEIGDGARRLE
ncbi:galactokinase [Ancylomarina subtilis]|uniref:Galactokinase n=1 Tax=Ancylomarina subtilis TaxID=1639035 RepID=A0A4Q7VHF0_9BACT|nr:galactokinase [Ancylomarina subtilis]RZT95503.1 galactokinase [Ancylomarina subtilis]